jgi:hypothetical protein
MAVLAAAIMLVIAAVAVLGGLTRWHRATAGPQRRPLAVSLTPVLFSIARVGSVIGGGLGKAPTPPASSASSVGQMSSGSQTVVGTAPVYPGPSNGAPLPRLNLPITFDYGSGPQPVPTPSYSPPLQPEPDRTTTPPPGDPSVTKLAVPTVPCPSYSPRSPGASGFGGPMVIGPCIAPPAPPIP